MLGSSSMAPNVKSAVRCGYTCETRDVETLKGLTRRQWGSKVPTLGDGSSCGRVERCQLGTCQYTPWA